MSPSSGAGGVSRPTAWRLQRLAPGCVLCSPSPVCDEGDTAVTPSRLRLRGTRSGPEFQPQTPAPVIGKGGWAEGGCRRPRQWPAGSRPCGGRHPAAAAEPRWVLSCRLDRRGAEPTLGMGAGGDAGFTGRKLPPCPSGTYTRRRPGWARCPRTCPLGRSLTQNSFAPRRSPGATGALDAAPTVPSVLARGARWGPSGALSLPLRDSTQPASLRYHGDGVGVSRLLGGVTRCVGAGQYARVRGPQTAQSVFWGRRGARPCQRHPRSRGESSVCVRGSLRAIVLQPSASCPREPADTSHPGEDDRRQCQSKVCGETKWPSALSVPSSSPATRALAAVPSRLSV